MEVTINGVPVSLPEGARLDDARRQHLPEASVLIVNGYQSAPDTPLHPGDDITLIEKGVMPSEHLLERMMAARHSPGVHMRVKQARVGIAGLGGLGSAIALMLARTGVGHLVLADFDVVEPSNLNRQNYLIRHLGMPKTEAMREQIAEVNPYITVDAHCVRVDASNAASLFDGCPVVCEAFDNPASKAEAITALLENLPDVSVIGASGMAGYGSCNAIRTSCRFGGRLYLCGDGETAAENGVGLMAPRVTACAAHQANMALRLLLGLTEA